MFPLSPCFDIINKSYLDMLIADTLYHKHAYDNLKKTKQKNKTI